ncbi:MAG: type II secretion system F family protein [Anaerolineae bacterium]|nr:type II secretion system F family protein [Anaerolineae bacterium]
MTSSKSSPKPGDKNSFKMVSPFDMFYQLTYMSAMASAGISRAKTFEIAALSKSKAAVYFKAINTLVDEFRYDYPEACHTIGLKAKSENIRSFLLRLADALRSGEPLAEFLAREAEVQSEDYENRYERDLEALKQWANAFSSIIMSVALIVIIQVITSMIYSMDVSVMGGLVATGLLMSALGAWVISRSAPREVMNVSPSVGSKEQKRALNLFKFLVPGAIVLGLLMNMLGVPLGVTLLIVAGMLLPVGIASMISDRRMNKKDVEFSTFLRSVGGMATSSGTTLKQALTKIDLSSFPYLESDIDRLSTRLQALVEPEICWHKFGQETGSKLISEVSDIFYSAVKIGGEPERVGFLCSLFTAKTAQLRAKRRLTASTFSGLTTVMQAVVAGLMVFVLSIVINFATMVETLMPQNDDALSGRPMMSLGMAEFSPEDLQFLSGVTVSMVLLLAVVSASAMIACDGGYKLKVSLYLSMIMFISGLSFLLVPPMVAGILTM